MGICLTKNTKKKQKSKEGEKFEKRKPSLNILNKKANKTPGISIEAVKDLEEEKINSNNENQEISKEEKNHFLQNKTTLRQKVLENNHNSPTNNNNKLQYTSKLSSTVDNSKRGLKNSLVIQKSTVRKLIEENGSTFRRVEKIKEENVQIDFSEDNIPEKEKINVIIENLKNEPDTVDKEFDFISIKNKIPLNINFGDQGNSIYSGLFTDRLSVNSEALGSAGHLDRKMNEYNRNSKAKNFVRKNLLFPEKSNGNQKSKFQIDVVQKKKKSLRKINTLNPNSSKDKEEESKLFSDVKESQSEICNSESKMKKSSPSEKRGRKGVKERTKSRKTEDKMTLQKYVLKKNQIDFLYNSGKINNENKSKKASKSGKFPSMNNFISEDDFSSSDSYLEDMSNEEDESGGILEMELKKSKKSIKKSLLNKTKENYKEIQRVNCTIEKMLQQKGSKFSELSSITGKSVNQESPSEFSMSSDKDASKEKREDGSMKIYQEGNIIDSNSKSLIGKNALENEGDSRAEGFEEFLKGKEKELFKL